MSTPLSLSELFEPQPGPVPATPLTAVETPGYVTAPEFTAALRESLSPLHDLMDRLIASSAVVAEAMNVAKRAYDEPFMQRIGVSPVNPYTCKLHGRLFNALLVNGAQVVQVFVAGLGYFTLNLAAGWNELDLPEGSELTVLNAGAAFNAVYRASNYRVSNAV